MQGMTSCHAQNDKPIDPLSGVYAVVVHPLDTAPLSQHRRRNTKGAGLKLHSVMPATVSPKTWKQWAGLVTRSQDQEQLAT